MASIVEAAKEDAGIAKRVDLFRKRIPEEFYDIEKDPNCLVNLIDNPEYKSRIEEMKKKLDKWMVDTNDPILEAFRNKDDRTKVNEVLVAAYGKPKAKKKKTKKKQK